MTRKRIAAVLGALVAIAGVLILLAGSDLPPPAGFAGVVVVAVVLGLLVRTAVPRMLDIRDRAGRVRGLGYALGLGVTGGFAVGVAFAAMGSGEPSAPTPTLPQTGLFLIVVAAAGGCAALGVGATAILADRMRSRSAAIMVITVAAFLVLVAPVLVISSRIAR